VVKCAFKRIYKKMVEFCGNYEYFNIDVKIPLFYCIFIML